VLGKQSAGTASRGLRTLQQQVPLGCCCQSNISPSKSRAAKISSSSCGHYACSSPVLYACSRSRSSSAPQCGNRNRACQQTIAAQLSLTRWPQLPLLLLLLLVVVASAFLQQQGLNLCHQVGGEARLAVSARLKQHLQQQQQQQVEAATAETASGMNTVVEPHRLQLPILRCLGQFLPQQQQQWRLLLVAAIAVAASQLLLLTALPNSCSNWWVLHQYRTAGSSSCDRQQLCCVPGWQQLGVE